MTEAVVAAKGLQRFRTLPEDTVSPCWMLIGQPCIKVFFCLFFFPHFRRESNYTDNKNVANVWSPPVEMFVVVRFTLVNNGFGISTYND